jgi:hypothetical protein
MSMVGLGFAIQALVALFEKGTDRAAEHSPGGMVVYLGPGSRRPDEDLQGAGSVRGILAMGYVPVPR